ncbi:MAG: glycogen debranching protein, partial [Ktedonobacteraceae bacterium]
MNPFDEEAYSRSLALLRTCLTAVGYVASPVQIDNYARVWARDGVITGLAGLASGELDMIDGLRRTLATLSQHAGPHGEIPSNVTLDGQQVSYGSLVGRVDSLLWYVIGVCAYVQFTGDVSQQVLHASVVERALFLAGCWEYNNRGLLYTPIAGDWADEYIQEGYVLYDELLYMLALRGAGLLYQNETWQVKAARLEHLLIVNYWPGTRYQNDPLVYHPHAYRYQIAQQEVGQQEDGVAWQHLTEAPTMNEARYWLPAFSPSGYATYFDGFAHALALLTALGDDAQYQQVECYVQSLEQQIGSALLPAFWPVILPGTVQWEQLLANHL